MRQAHIFKFGSRFFYFKQAITIFKMQTRSGAAFILDEGFAGCGDGFGIGCQCLTAGSALALVPATSPSLPPLAAQGAAPPRLVAAAQSAAVEAVAPSGGGGPIGGVFGAAVALTALKLKLAGPDHGGGAGGAALLAEPVLPASAASAT